MSDAEPTTSGAPETGRAGASGAMQRRAVAIGDALLRPWYKVLLLAIVLGGAGGWLIWWTLQAPEEHLAGEQLGLPAWPAFLPTYGSLGCLLCALLAWLLAPLLRRKEDYYDAG